MKIIKKFKYFTLLWVNFFVVSCNEKIETNTIIISKKNQQTTILDTSEGRISMIYIYANDIKLEVDLVDNNSTKELIEHLKKQDITVSMQKNGGFEQFGDLGVTLTTENQELTA